MKMTVMMVILVLSCVAAAATGQLIHLGPLPDSENSKDALRVVSGGMEQFALDMFVNTGIEGGPEMDLVLSPFSVWAMLVLTAEGAAGRTLTELQQVLRLPAEFRTTRDGYRAIERTLNVNTSTIQLETVNALFTDINRPVDPDYETLIESIYRANLVPVNFHDTSGTVRLINNYIKEKTRGKISDLVTPSDLQDAQLIVTNAIFFKGQWAVPFNKSLTKSEPFFDEQERKLGDVNMMTQLGVFPYAMMQQLDAHVVELPYGKQHRLSMYVVLPRKGVSVDTVMQNIKKTKLTTIYEALKNYAEEYMDEDVEVHIPRFAITSELTLNVVLERMGILDVFDPYDANLSKMSRAANIFLSRIIHKATIEVTEEGTIASAATGGVLINKASPPRFNANRPFIYLIVEKTTNILVFAGKVTNPTTFKI